MIVYPMMIGIWEIVAIVFIIVLLVGGKKIPELMKGVGKGVRSFKEGLNGIEEEVNKSVNAPKEGNGGKSGGQTADGSDNAGNSAS